jgi:pimeloyl-ACP methyl ester carboxylesterase
MTRFVIFTIVLLVFSPNIMFADDSRDDGNTVPTNVQGPTLGGKQFWTDELVCRDWRIQQHAWTGHYRLLDDKNVRQAWGTFKQCRERFEFLRREQNLPPMQGKVVVALHGLVRSRHSMDGLADYLREQGEYTIVNVSYASTRNRLDQHAQSLASVIENLGPEVTEINFVAHSLGNLVIRHYLGDQNDAAAGKQVDPRINRIVMLAPPNNGTQFAEKFRDNKLFQAIWGKSGLQLAKSWPELEKRLATPRCEFGIIAGGRGEAAGRNPFLRGDDDFVVSVEETRLPGASDFAVLPALHSLIMDDPKTKEYVLRFFRHGYLVSAKQRDPIPIDETDGGNE